MIEPDDTTPVPDAATPAVAAAFFDVDRTLIAGASTLRMARPFRQHGLVSRRQQLRAAVLQIGFLMRGADDAGIERFSEQARSLVRGWDQAEVRRIVAETIEHNVHPVVYREALERIDLHRRLGHPVYAVSATIRDIVEPLSQLLGLDGAIASELEVTDGVYTGGLSVVCHGEEKARHVRAFAAERGIDLDSSYAYSDSISDRPLLQMVGRPYAVNPDRELRRIAEQEGWGVLFFRTRIRLALHQRRVARLSTAGLAVAALAAASLRRRRRRRAR